MLELTKSMNALGPGNAAAACRGLGNCAAKVARPLTTVFVAALAFGGLVAQSLAAPPGAPADGEVYFNCTIGAGGLSGFTLGDPSAFAGLDIDYIVIYSKDNEFNGQQLAGDGTTGPIVCHASDLDVSASAESVPLPNSTDNPGVESIDILENNGNFILKYKNNNAGPVPGDVVDGRVDNRVCLTASGVECGIIFDPADVVGP
jgi:hypothetical protein